MSGKAGSDAVRGPATDHEGTDVVGLHLGDGLAGLRALPDGAVDVTIADPPFDDRTHRAALEAGDWRDGRRQLSALPFEPLTDADIERAAAEIARVTRRWIVLFTADRQLEAWALALEAAGARFIRGGVAVRTNPRPQLTGDRPAPAVDHLVIAHRAGVKLRWNGGGRPARWDSPPARFDPGGQIHPTQKPLALMRALVSDFSDPGELVCDPFAGAATTAVACHERDRYFVGWELDEGFHRQALHRLELASRQLQLGLERATARADGEQLALFESEGGGGNAIEMEGAPVACISPTKQNHAAPLRAVAPHERTRDADHHRRPR